MRPSPRAKELAAGLLVGGDMRSMIIPEDLEPTKDKDPLVEMIKDSLAGSWHRGSLTDAAQSILELLRRMNMVIKVPRCEVCRTKQATQMHHRLSQTKWARRLYGPLIDDCRNIQFVCTDCHSSHASSGLTHWSEQDFCNALSIEPRSKISKMKEEK